MGGVGVCFVMLALLRFTRWQGVIVTSVGDAVSYRLSPWWLAWLAVPTTVIFLLGTAVITVRHILARVLGALVVLVAVVMIVALAPMPWDGGLVLTPDGFTHTAGFWWRPKVQRVRFESLESMRVVSERDEDGRTSRRLECRGKDGAVVDIPMSTVLEVGLTRVLAYGARRGVVLRREALAGVRQGAPGAWPVARSGSPFRHLAVVVLVVVVTYVALRYSRRAEAGVRRALKRAAEGDVEGAIADLREQIELEGPTQDRVNALGNLLFHSKKWDEAAAQFRKAEELGPLKSVCRANLGVALLEAGKPEQALPVLQAAAHLAAGIPMLAYIVAVHTTRALAELGRYEEARAQFLQTERIGRKLSRSARESMAEPVEKCRKRLEEAERGVGEPRGG